MSSGSSPALRTPPDPVAGADVKVALDFSALDDTLSETPAVGGVIAESTIAWDWATGRFNAKRHVHHNVRLGRHVLPEGEDLARSPSLSPSLNPINADGNTAYSLPVSPLAVSRSSSVSSSEPSPLSSSTDLSDLAGLDDEVAAAQHMHSGAGERIPEAQVKCMVRTRVPTPHGEVFLHLYHNDRDGKEHLAVVYDPTQLDADKGTGASVPHIRSKSLDAVWYDDETPMERVTRGAYVGRLSQEGYTISSPVSSDANTSAPGLPAPLVRIHSECFTGETIGSMRCDCGEQLDEALRRIAEPVTFVDPGTNKSITIPGRGAVIYMRQEGRGIGLLSKLRAYNLQDLGHDTVQANLLLGHGADERNYDVAAAIMRDLGLGEGVRLLTNNPDKVEKLADAGVRIAERVPMVPRSWRCQSEDAASVSTTVEAEHTRAEKEEEAARLRSAGATLIGAGAAHGPELEKYLRTKVLRMGHMLSLPTSVSPALY